MNSCLCHLSLFVLVSLFSDSSASFSFICFICFGESMKMKPKNFTGVSYRIWDIFGILWGLPVKLKVSLVGRCASCIGMKVRSKLTLHRVTRHLFSHTLV